MGGNMHENFYWRQQHRHVTELTTSTYNNLKPSQTSVNVACLEEGTDVCVQSVKGIGQ